MEFMEKKKINNKISRELLKVSCIKEYPVCDQSLVILSSFQNNSFDYELQVLFVIVDLYLEDINNTEIKNCVICKDILFVPKILKCGHIFCFACIILYIETTGLLNPFKCPVCSKSSKLKELKSIIWRIIEKPKIGSQLIFSLYYYNTELQTIEKVKNNIMNETKKSLKKHTFENWWNNVEHLGRGQLEIDCTKNNLLLPKNNKFYVTQNQTILTLFDIEKAILMDKLNDTELECRELNAYLICNDNVNNFVNQLQNKNVLKKQELNNEMNVSFDMCPKNNSEKKINEKLANLLIESNLRYNSNFIKTNFNKINLNKTNFNKTNFDICKNSTNKKFDKYVYFYKSETYFNLYLCEENCEQLKKHVQEINQSLKNDEDLPLTITGKLISVFNYESQVFKL